MGFVFETQPSSSLLHIFLNWSMSIQYKYSSPASLLVCPFVLSNLFFVGIKFPLDASNK